MEEYKEVLRRKKFPFSAETLQEWETLIDRDTRLVSVNREVDFPRDQKDAKFLACALSNNADLFITGDGDFEEAYKVINTTVISVSMFYQTLMTGGRQLRSDLEVQRYHQIASTKLDSVIDWSKVIKTAPLNIAPTTIMRSCISGMAVRSRSFKADS